MNALKLSVILALAAPVGFVTATAPAATPAGVTQTAANQPAVQVSAQNQEHLDELTKAYLSAQRLLVQDKFDGVAGDFAKIRSQAKDLARSDDPALAKLAQAVAGVVGQEPKDLTEARTQLQEDLQCRLRSTQDRSAQHCGRKRRVSDVLPDGQG